MSFVCVANDCKNMNGNVDTHRAFKAKNKKYFYWKKFHESKLHADYETYKKNQNKA